MTSDCRIELLLAAEDVLGEGPAWDPDERALRWVDIERRRVRWHRPADGWAREIELPLRPGAVVRRDADTLVAAVDDGFALIDVASGALTPLAHVEADDAASRMNDGKCDAAGRFWAGTMALDERVGAHALYRLDPDGTVTRALDGLTLSNGLGWSPDGLTLYFVDTPTQQLDAIEFDPATGALGARRTLARIAPEDGMPDGLTVDAEGCVWVALWGGWAVRRYAPTGELERVVRLPVSQPTCPCFGGDALDELYVTSAREGLDAQRLAREPLAGGVFRCTPGVRGLPAARYGAGAGA